MPRLLFRYQDFQAVHDASVVEKKITSIFRKQRVIRVCQRHSPKNIL